MRLKGMADPVRAVTLGPPRPARSSPRDTAMVGREAELGQVMTALDRLGDGAGGRSSRSWARPGMGKTRLASEVLAGADDFRVVTAECGHSGAARPT